MQHIICTHTVAAILCCGSEVWASRATGGILSNFEIHCSINEDEGRAITTGSDVFWLVNGMLYGLLQVPLDFEVCCLLDTLRIPVAQQEMDGYTFQCVHVDYQTHTVYLGGVTVLEVITLSSLPAGLMGS